MFPNEVFIDPKEKERLIELLAEADSILDKYPYSLDVSYRYCNVSCKISRS